MTQKETQKVMQIKRNHKFRKTPLWLLMSVTGILLAGELAIAGELADEVRAPSSAFSTPSHTTPSALLLGDVPEHEGKEGKGGKTPEGEMPQSRSESSSRGWWGTDVWHDPNRPFLYYGIEKEKPKDVKKVIEEKVPEKATSEESIQDTRQENVVVISAPEKAERVKANRVEAEHEEVSRASSRTENTRQKTTEKEKVIALSKTESIETNGKVGYRELESITTIAELKKEREARLEIAIMNPSAENMVRYQEVNAYMLGLAHRFASAWEKARFANPEYDWTATHSPANFARTEMSEVKRQQTTQVMSALSQVSALIFLVDPTDPMAPLMAKTVKALADTHHFEVLVIVKRPRELSRVAALGLLDDKALSAYLSDLSPIKLDTGHAERLGLKTLPALLLLPNKEAGKVFPGLIAGEALGGEKGTWPMVKASTPKPLLIATGVVSMSECERRLVALLRENPTPRDNDPAMVPMNERIAALALKVSQEKGNESAEKAQEKGKEKGKESRQDVTNDTEKKTAKMMKESAK